MSRAQRFFLIIDAAFGTNCLSNGEKLFFYLFAEITNNKCDFVNSIIAHFDDVFIRARDYGQQVLVPSPYLHLLQNFYHQETGDSESDIVSMVRFEYCRNKSTMFTISMSNQLKQTQNINIVINVKLKIKK